MTESDVIDLTDSFTLIDHCNLANVVIELDDSLNEAVTYRQQEGSSRNKKTPASSRLKILSRNKSLQPTPKQTESTKLQKSSHGFGDCPICWEFLGANPLASTKCGHVFCLKCLEVCLRQVKKCPTCRCVLKGSSAYHPIYI